jgi:2-aminoethylphosphonate aminotransferase
VILLNPGPANTSATVKAALGVPDICPREPEFGEVLRVVGDLLTRVVHDGDSYTSVLFGGSGTAAVEATLASSVPLDGRLLVIDNGSYGARMAEIAMAYGMPHHRMVLGMGVEVVPEAVERELETGGYTQLAVVHHETSTGILNPVEDLGPLAAKFGVELIVDAMSSYAGLAIDVESAGIDFLVASSNKCIQGMAGVGFVICRRARAHAMAPVPGRSLYLSLGEQYRFFERNLQMRFTPPVPIIYALQQALREFFEEGPEARYARYRENFEVLDSGMLELGFQHLIPPRLGSGILTAYLEPPGPDFTFEDLHDRLYEKGFTIYPGKGGERSAFRLANMGAVTAQDMRAFLVALRETLLEMGIPIPVSGSSVA